MPWAYRYQCLGCDDTFNGPEPKNFPKSEPQLHDCRPIPFVKGKYEGVAILIGRVTVVEEKKEEKKKELLLDF